MAIPLLRPVQRAPHALALLVALAASGACTTLELVDPSEPIALAPDEGLVIVHVASDVRIERLDMDGVPVLVNVTKGMSFRIFKARAGEHRFSQLVVTPAANPGPRSPRWYVRFERIPGSAQYGTFRVEPGRLAYPGQIVVETAGQGRHFRMQATIRNRSAVAWMHLRRVHAHLLDAFPMVYTGPVPDDFLDRYLDREAAR
ncbi:MAG: hypothetical protein KC560_10305 [Myxococcales bacterium]|nr:hypothetical protein [Myxococcales bacterium]